MSPLSIRTSCSIENLETGKAKMLLLSIGIDRYRDRLLPALNYAVSDCQELSEALVLATEKFKQKEIIVHHDSAPLTPDLKRVRSSLEYIAKAAQAEDTVLFYFSGHGFLDPKTQQPVLCLADTEKERLLETGLALQELLQFFSKCNAQRQLVWLDACHSGSATILGNTDDSIANRGWIATELVDVLRKRAAQSKGFYALLSCDAGQQSWEFPELKHGVFTYYLIRGLRGEAADDRGKIEMDGLYKYVYHRTLQYVDKTNQQLRLINQQKRGRGETILYPEYSLQTPKRLVEGVGEIILGLAPTSRSLKHLTRYALVVDGLSNASSALTLSKVLKSAGGFELDYWPGSNKKWSELTAAIKQCLRYQSRISKDNLSSRSNAKTAEIATALLYLRGKIEETSEGEAWLVLGNEIRISRSWLRQILRYSAIDRQIIIFDCPAAPSLASWVEDLQIGHLGGQCLIAAAAGASAPEVFTKALLQTLLVTEPQAGLTVAGWITMLQIELAGTEIPLHLWLSGAKGVIEILPATARTPERENSEDVDLGICPYMGLKAFSETDAQYFYGRELLTQKLIERIAQQPFLAVVGASGSGKSSLVRAGLMAQLRQGKQIPGSDRWWLGCFRPGVKPIESLIKRLLDPAKDGARSDRAMQIEGLLHLGAEGFVYWLRSRLEPRIVLVIDQFEELFALASATDRQNFLDILLGALEYAADRFKLIITLRADTIASALEIPKLVELLQRSSILVPPCLRDEQYRQTILQPAKQVGLKVEPELVEILLEELPHNAGDLPLLQFVLEQLWVHRDRGILTLKSYQQHLGGMKGVIERKARAVYESLNSEERACAEWIFLSLIHVGEGTQDTRRRVSKSDLIVAKYPPALVERTLKILLESKLIAVNLESNEANKTQKLHVREKNSLSGFVRSKGAEDATRENEELSLAALKQEVTIEIAHEILIRSWSTLQWWLEENRNRLRSLRQIEQAARLWKQNGLQSEFLLTGVRLGQAEEIYIKYTDELASDSQEFIAACLAQRAQQSRQAKRRLRIAQITAVITSVLGLAALSFALIAYGQKQKIEIEALNSKSQNLSLSNRQIEALAVSVQAARQSQNSIGLTSELKLKTVANLQQILHLIRERNSWQAHNYSVNDVIFSPDGQTIASASDDKTIKLWTVSGSLLKIFTGHTDSISSISFSPDGQLLASASYHGSVKLWQIKGKDNDRILPVLTFKANKDRLTRVSFSPDSQLLASASESGNIQLWNLSGSSRQTFKAHSAGITSLAWSRDSKILVSAAWDKTIKFWDLDGKLIRTLNGHTEAVNSINFSPDGQRLASASNDGKVKIWRIDGREIATLKTTNAAITSLAWSSDRQILALGNDRGTIEIWNELDKKLATFKAHSDRINRLDFSRDGKTLVSASVDNTVKIWSFDRPVGEGLTGCSQETIKASFSRDRQMAIVVCNDNTLKLLNRQGKILKTIAEEGDILNYGSLSPNGQLIAAAANSISIDRRNYLVKLWHRDGVLLKVLPGHQSWVNSVVFSPDNRLIASASDDKTVKVWHFDGRELVTLKGHTDAVNSLSFSHNGKIIASASKDATVKLWSLDGRELQTFAGHTDAVTQVIFSSDDRLIATASIDNTVRLWQLNGQLLAILKGHQDSIDNLSFSGDSKFLATASKDSSVKLWSVKGQIASEPIPLQTFESHRGGVLSASFSSDGKDLVSIGTDNKIILWNLDLEENIRQGCNWLNNYLQTNPNLSGSSGHLCDGISVK